jgi:hypothetical protein
MISLVTSQGIKMDIENNQKVRTVALLGFWTSPASLSRLSCN